MNKERETNRSKGKGLLWVLLACWPVAALAGNLVPVHMDVVDFPSTSTFRVQHGGQPGYWIKFEKEGTYRRTLALEDDIGGFWFEGLASELWIRDVNETVIAHFPGDANPWGAPADLPLGEISGHLQLVCSVSLKRDVEIWINGELWGLLYNGSTDFPFALLAADTFVEAIRPPLSTGVQELRIYDVDWNLVAADPDYVLWTVGVGPSSPQFASSPPTSAVKDIAYSYTPTVTGVPTPTVTASGLSAWLSWDGTELSGTPAEVDVGTTGVITLTASNGVNPDVTQEFQIVVSLTAPSSSRGGGDCGGGVAVAFAVLLLVARRRKQEKEVSR